MDERIGAVCTATSGEASRASIVHRDRRRSGRIHGGGSGEKTPQMNNNRRSDVTLCRVYKGWKKELLAQTLRITIVVFILRRWNDARVERRCDAGKTAGAIQAFPFATLARIEKKRRRGNRVADVLARRRRVAKALVFVVDEPSRYRQLPRYGSFDFSVSVRRLVQKQHSIEPK